MGYKKLQMFKCSCAPAPCVIEGILDVPDEQMNLTCCGEPVEALQPRTADKTTEKHVPVIEKIDGGYKVTVGTTPHPMKDEHYIMWIELRIGSAVMRQYLQPGDEPIAHFYTGCDGCPSDEDHKPVALEFCNVHSLWKGDSVE